MNLIITLAVLFSGGLHGFTFAVILIKVFGLHKQNLLIPERITNFEERASLLMGNTIVITFIVVSNVAWTDYFANPLRVYAGMGLIVGSIVFIAAVIGCLVGISISQSKAGENDEK
jgi:hypothetical protein